MHRMMEACAAITRELGNLQLNTTNIPHLMIDHILQMAEQNEETQETAAPTGENSLTATYSRPTRHSQYAEIEYFTEEREVMSIRAAQ